LSVSKEEKERILREARYRAYDMESYIKRLGKN
jgi:hypothetical protein